MSRVATWSLAVTALFICGSARTADAQFRYLLSADAHERYNSDIFAGVANERWDMITELQPALRFYYNFPSALLWARYDFTFQVFGRTDDPSTGRRLLGFGNRLNLEYTKLFTASTGMHIFNRFAQGTENVQVLGGINTAGGIDTGFLSTGSKFFTDQTRVAFEHLWSRRWHSGFHVEGGFYRAYERSSLAGVAGFSGAAGELVAPPNSWEVSALHRLNYILQTDVLSLATSLTSGMDQSPQFPQDLNTVFLEIAPGWRHYFDEFWDVGLNAGLNLRFRQFYRLLGTAPEVYYDTTVGPVGGATVRYRYGRLRSISLEYAHEYDLVTELQTSATAADTDRVALAFLWNQGDWIFEGGASFRYLRTSPRQQDGITDQASTKIVEAQASVGYLVRQGLTLDVAYDFDTMRDRPVVATTGLPEVGRLRDWTRHQITVGISFAWPPPPEQDAQLNRRASASDPIFNLSPGGGVGSTLATEDIDSLMQARQERARRQRDADERRGPAQPAQPESELFDMVPER